MNPKPSLDFHPSSLIPQSSECYRPHHRERLATVPGSNSPPCFRFASRLPSTARFGVNFSAFCVV